MTDICQICLTQQCVAMMKPTQIGSLNRLCIPYEEVNGCGVPVTAKGCFDPCAKEKIDPFEFLAKLFHLSQMMLPMIYLIQLLFSAIFPHQMSALPWHF